MTEAEQTLREIIAKLPESTIEQLDSVGYSVETNHMFAVMSRSGPEVVGPLRRLLDAVNNELTRRGVAIRKQDRPKV